MSAERKLRVTIVQAWHQSPGAVAVPPVRCVPVRRAVCHAVLPAGRPSPRVEPGARPDGNLGAAGQQLFHEPRGNVYRTRRPPAFVVSTAITLALGLAFLVGVVGVEWRIAPFGPGDGPQGSVFYMLTGMHAFHVFTGVLFLAHRSAQRAARAVLGGKTLGRRGMLPTIGTLWTWSGFSTIRRCTSSERW